MKNGLVRISPVFDDFPANANNIREKDKQKEVKSEDGNGEEGTFKITNSSIIISARPVNYFYQEAEARSRKRKIDDTHDENDQIRIYSSPAGV